MRCSIVPIRTLWVSLAVSLLLVVSCVKKKSGKNKDPGLDLSAVPPKATVKVLDAGAEPRRKLRYRIPKGSTETVVMDMRMTMKMALGDREIPEVTAPTMVFKLRLDVTQVHPSGDMDISASCPAVDVVDRPGVPPQLLRVTRQALQAYKGFTASWTLTPRGVSKNVRVQLPPGLPPQLRQMLDTFKQQLHTMSPPLPKEAVGEGARWVTKLPLHKAAFVTGQQMQFTLKKLEADTATCALTIKQWAPPQDVKAAGLPAGAKIRLRHFRSAGFGSQQIFFQRMAIVYQGKLDAETRTVITSGDQTQKMAMKMGLAVDIKPQAAH